jgi:signal transduction histidine kinase
VTRISLKVKFILAFVGLTVLFAATFGVLATRRLHEVLLEQVRIRSKVVVEDFAREAGGFIVTPEGITEAVASSRLTRRLVAGTVLYAQIVRDGKLRFTDGRSEMAGPVAIIGQPLVVEERVTADGLPYLDLMRAIPEFTLDQQTYVRIGFSLAAVYARIRVESRVIAVASLALVAAGIIAAFVLQRAILGPVDRMTGAIRRLRGGDYSARIQTNMSDELRLLGDEFNTMASAIEVRDLELARINREMAEVNEALRKANRIKDEFSAAMSHELKTPLHAIRAYAQLVLEGIDGPLTDAQRKDLDAILGAGDHLLHLIEGILRYSALEAGGIVPQIGNVKVAAALEAARQNVDHLARAKGLPIEVHTDGADTVRADETMLRQILINLLHNAVKYTPQGRITVTTSLDNGQVTFAVTDTGPGIAPEDGSAVFEPFRRAGHASRREIDGIGLGLAVVKRYVDLLGGRIWFESGAGGTTFFFTMSKGSDA